MNSIEQILLESGWTPDRVKRVHLARVIRPKVDLKGKQLGLINVFGPVGFLDNSILWACRCQCGKPVLRTAKELINREYANCGCLLQSHAYYFWQRNKYKFHPVWRQNFERFYQECWLEKSNKEHLNRLDLHKKLSKNNFYWSYSTEREHQIYDEVVEILQEQGLSLENAKEQTKLMGIKKRRRIIKEYKFLQEKTNVKFMKRYGKVPPLIKQSCESFKIEPIQLAKLVALTKDIKYNGLEIELLRSDEKLMCKCNYLPSPLVWNEKTGEWDV